MSPLPLAIIGAGKIARDQHFSAILESRHFTLAAVVDPMLSDLGVPTFASLTEMQAQGPAIAAVAICTPPQLRTAIALEAIDAGYHVLLEKPPAATLSDAAKMVSAARPDRTIFAAWHSRHGAMVAVARAWLVGKVISSGSLVWREDAHRWHPGQQWLWQPGGLGVFDPAINAFSILTAITDASWSITSAAFQIPSGLHAPLSAQLEMCVDGAPVAADLHFHDDDTAEWTIVLTTEDGSTLALHKGGASLTINGVPIHNEGDAEYPGVYARFAELIAESCSEIDVRPLRLVADAFLLARSTIVEPFQP